MLKSVNRRRKRKEFAYLYNHGNAKHSANLTIVYNPTKNRELKIGFSIAKKIGKANVRNLVKRRLRDIVKDIVPNMPDEFNVVFIAKVGIEKLSYSELKKQVEVCISKAGLFKNVV